MAKQVEISNQLFNLSLARTYDKLTDGTCDSVWYKMILSKYSKAEELVTLAIEKRVDF